MYTSIQSIHICTAYHVNLDDRGLLQSVSAKAQERMEATLAEVKNAEDAITQLEVPAVSVGSGSPKIIGFLP